MKNTGLLVVFILLFASSNSMAQKLKYKDIFELIEKKDYDTAIPQINAFLKDSKNEEHANAHLQKGLYFEQKIEQYHIIADSTALLQESDSAIFFLNKAKSLINDKELKKNSEYYQSFYRRDLRTGDFGIKLSDVSLDLEKKIAALQDLSKYAKIICKNLEIADRNYKLSNEQYRQIATIYSSQNDFFLIATETEKDALQGMVERTDSIRTAIDAVRGAVSKLGRKGYSPEIQFMEIKKFGEDGMTKADFFQNDIVAWDYLAWAENAQQNIRIDVSRMRDNLNQTYDDLKAKFDLVKSGGGINEGELATSIDSNLKSQIRSVDENPLPEKLLNILINHTQFTFITNKKLNTKLADESDVNYQLSITKKVNTLIDDISTQTSTLVEPYTTDGTKKYSNFIETNYGGEFGLIKYRKGLESQFDKEKMKWKELQSYWTEKSKWGVSEDAADSIYLIARTDSSYTSMKLSKFYTLSITEDDSANIFAFGLEFTGDKDKGYLAKIGNDRLIKWKVNFDLDNFQYDAEVLRVNGAYAPTAEGDLAGYLYSNVPESKNNFIIFNSSKQGQLNWATAVKITNEPVSIKFNDFVKETNVFLMDEKALETYEGDDPIYIVFDRKGAKVR